MRITVEKPQFNIPYYLAVQDGPVRKIIVEADCYSEAFVGVLTQIAEQGRELAESSTPVDPAVDPVEARQ